MNVSKHRLEKELEELLGGDAGLFGLLARGTIDGLWYWDLERPDEEWMSPEFWRLFGVDPSSKSHSPQEWQDIIFPEDRDLALANFQKHCEDPSHPYDQVVRYRHADGSTVWVRCRGLALRDETGKPVRMLGAHTDLTRLKRTEEALEQTNEMLRQQLEQSDELVRRLDEANQRYNLALAGASVGIWDWFDVTGDAEYWSPRFYQLLGYDDGEIEPSLNEFKRLLHPDDHARTFAAVGRHFDEGEPFDIEYRLKIRSGEYRWFRGTGLAARNDSGNATRMVGSIQDISKRVEATHLLERANEDLEQFAHIAAHDLREPARRQRMLANFALEDHADILPAELKKDLERIREQSDAMLAMITGFRALTGFRGAAVQAEELDLGALFEKVAAEAEPDCTADVQWRVTLSDPVICYPSLVEIMVRNLVQNALRHGARPLVVSVDEERREGIRWFACANTWNGDPAAASSDLFKPFTSTGESAGSGLGLSVCKRVVDHHRGGIRIDPTPGSFRIEFHLGEEQ